MKAKLKHWLTKVFFRPFLLALPFALVTIYLIPVRFNSTILELKESYPSNKVGRQSIVHFTDLNEDGHDEEIIHFITSVGQCAVKITTHNNTYFGQWNFNGTLPENYPIEIFDHDLDGKKEVFVIYHRNDSIFFGAVDYRIDSAKLYEDIFLDKVQKVNNDIHYGAKMFHHDLNNDGRDEMVISINAGYSEKPRKVYAYYFQQDSLISSIQTGYYNNNLHFVDLNDDGFPEIVSSTNSNENIEPGLGIPYDDYHRWFVIYNNDLGFYKGPVNLGDGGGSVKTLVYKFDEGPKILARDNNNKDAVRTRLYSYNPKTDKLRRITTSLDSTNISSPYKFNLAGEQAILLLNSDNGKLYNFFPEKDSLAMLLNIEGKSINIYGLNINQDTLPELLVHKKLLNEEYLEVFSNNLSRSFRMELPEKGTPFLLSTRNYLSGNKHLVIQIGENLYEYRYGYDPYYWVKTFSLHFGIYLVYFVMIWLILRIQRSVVRKRYRREQFIAELKLKSIRNQMDPHFTFNAINAIASAIYKEDKKTAYSYFSKFSKLIRSTMLYSDRMSRFLDDEIDFTMKYLEIEKFRFREKFDFKIDVAEDVNLHTEVPRMIVQAFAESAIANGLMHRSKGGLLEIDIRQNDTALIITFTDNGVGIEKSKEFNKEKAFKPIRIIDEFIAVFNEFNESKVTYDMFDTKENGQVTGTRVIIRVPFDINYTFQG